MLKLKWRYGPGQKGCLVKVSCERGSPLAEHTHDFPEIFWIEEGVCQHRINGRRETLEAGDLVFIRANQDYHQFIATGRRRFTMTNLECHPRLIGELRTRHPRPFADWFRVNPALPVKVRLDGGGLNRIRRMALDFSARMPDPLHTEAFLLDLARLLEPARPLVPGQAGCPDWLRSALLKAQMPDIFTRGVAGLVAVAGCSPEHLARSCRRYLDRTPTQILETCRMSYAEGCLRFTTDSVTEIAYACGYATTAQFYRAFRRHHRLTPLHYRRWLQGVAGEEAAAATPRVGLSRGEAP